MTYDLTFQYFPALSTISRSSVFMLSCDWCVPCFISFVLEKYQQFLCFRLKMTVTWRTCIVSLLLKVFIFIKACLHTGFLSQQLNAIFVAPKLQLQNRTCKPLCDFGAIFAIYRRGMRYNSRNTVTLSSIFTF